MAVMGIVLLSGSNLVTATDIKIENLKTELANASNYIMELEREISKHPDYKPAQENLSIMKDAYAKAVALYDILPCLDKEDDTRCGIITVNAKRNNFMNEIDTLVQEIYSCPNTVNYFNGYYDLDEWRKNIVNTAIKSKDKIVYDWGKKPQRTEWHNEWDDKRTGLDCSGFVAWVYWNSTNTQNIDLYSTFSITKTQTSITYEELLPGDLGTFLAEGTYYTTIQDNKYYTMDDVKDEYEEYCTTSQNTVPLEEYYKTSTNHVGIYAGKDENGKDMWIHCKGYPENTVVIDNCEKFQYFYSVKKGNN